MKKIVIIAIILFAAILMPQKVNAHQLQQTASAQLAIGSEIAPRDDIRVQALEKVFERYNSPLKSAAPAYVALADKNGVDWKLLPAISGLESGFGKHLMPNSYNAYGWGGGYIYFESWEHGIDTITQSLKSRYYDRGADTVWTIGPIYAESPTWAVRVNSFINSIEKEYIDILKNEVEITI